LAQAVETPGGQLREQRCTVKLSGWLCRKAESAEGFEGVFDAKQGSASGPSVGLEWASFDLGTIETAESVAAPGAAVL
jgi:hypothetical protein